VVVDVKSATRRCKKIINSKKKAFYAVGFYECNNRTAGFEPNIWPSDLTNCEVLTPV